MVSISGVLIGLGKNYEEQKGGRCVLLWPQRGRSPCYAAADCCRRNPI